MYTDLNNIHHVPVRCHAVKHVEASFVEGSSSISAASEKDPDTAGVADKTQTHTVVPA